VYVSRVAAAELLGVASTTVDSMIARGMLPVARPGDRNVRSLLFSDVEKLARRREERAARPKRPRREPSFRLAPWPPGLWLTPEQAGLVLGVTGQAVRMWARAEKVPATRLEDGRWLLRVADVVMVARCRRVSRTRVVEA